MKSLTTDTFFNGRIRVKQHRNGYRFSIDAVLLAFHVRPRPRDRILELGTGCGIISLLLAYRNPDISVYAIEIQEMLAEIASLNVEENQMADRISVICKDMKELKQNMLSGAVDWVISNPPYRRVQAGRINPDDQRAVARHEIMITLSDVLETARSMLRNGGRFAMIFPAERTADIVEKMRSLHIEPKFLRMIHSGRHTEAKLILVEGMKGGRPGAKIGPPLIIYRENGSYTDEAEKMFLP
ncbi:MAG TPA: tRNA1(Val) (adenine(37)-N6)-methyltransferase [Desulfobacterales bacterium]|nr:tRNA1(Val) (adenine(37)-N6)-methyltransferase [Desulfobacterales bacterium]